MDYFTGVSGGPVSAYAVSGGVFYEQTGVGAAVVTQADDTVVATGVLAIAGTLAVTQESDGTASAGVVLVAGAAGVTQADDTLSATAAITLVGAAALGQDDDTLDATGVLPLVGEATLSQAGDTAEGSFIVGTFGFLAEQYRFVGVSGYAVSAFAVSGQYFQDRPGAIAQQSDTIAATGAVLTHGIADLTQADDTLSATGTLLIAAAADLSQAGDTMSADSEIRARIRLRGASIGGGAKGGVSSVGGGAKMRLAA